MANWHEKLDKNAIQALLGEATSDVKAECEAILTDTLERLEGWGLDTNRPKLKYDLKGHTAGYAINGDTIRLNLQLLNDERYKDDMLRNTLPHEIAHICVMQRYPRAKGHGVEWKSVMFKLGLNAERCHQYKTTAAKKPRARPYTAYCGCVEVHRLTLTIARRMTLDGEKYRCRKCGQHLRKGW